MMDNSFYAQRKSIRKYKSTEVNDEDLIAMLDAARVAPSAKNRQPWRFVVVRGAEKEKLLEVMAKGVAAMYHKPFMPKKFRNGLASAENTMRIMGEAPVIILVFNKNSNDPFKSKSYGKRVSEIHDTMSIGAAIQNMLLCAASRGLGTLWIGNTVYAHKEITKLYNTKEQLAAAVAVGFPDEEPEGRPKFSLDEIVQGIDIK